MSVRDRIGGFVALTKPRIIELLLVTTVPTMVLAAGGWPGEGALDGLLLVIATVIGGTLAAGSANTFNMWYDRDIDAIMSRTQKRPLVTGVVSPVAALVFAFVLAAASVLWLGLLVNWLAAWLALAANAMYSIGYTILLKRHTTQNIVWGGAAGCMPVLIGWAAVTDSLGWAPVLLFGIIFFWTPPHYWPLSMKFKKDYADAGVPMLPVSAPAPLVAWQMVAYAAAMIGCSLALVPVAGMGWFYGIVALAAGAWFGLLCVQLWRRARSGARKLLAMKVFHGSITYLTIVFLAVLVDPFLPF
ncbi:heme o synthase [Pseudactinotalea sp. HY158]|uniref:heme o synthase n=1 Tax=unclassified Pseudactinotalea TaxID=2649176 RepID=UPI001E2B2965|nr:heme o synthase [Pseudactinotalea sp. HY158]